MFGLKNSPDTLQRAMDFVLSTVQWQFALLYLNDIFEKPTDTYQTRETLLDATARCRRAHEFEKGEFFLNPTKYLGHIIHHVHLAASYYIIYAIRNRKPTTNISELRSFLGSGNVFKRFVCNFFRGSVPNILRIAAWLNSTLRKYEPTYFENHTKTIYLHYIHCNRS